MDSAWTRSNCHAFNDPSAIDCHHCRVPRELPAGSTPVTVSTAGWIQPPARKLPRVGGATVVSLVIGFAFYWIVLSPIVHSALTGSGQPWPSAAEAAYLTGCRPSAIAAGRDPNAADAYCGCTAP